MGNKRQVKDIINEEKVFRAVAQNPGDIVTIQERLLKHKVLDSRTKISRAMQELISAGRLVLKGKDLQVSPSAIFHGKYVEEGRDSYVILDGDSNHYYIDRRDTSGVRSNDRVELGFYYFVTKQGTKKVPFIIGREKTKVSTADELLKPMDTNIVYGRVMKTSHDELVFMPNDHRRFSHPIFISNDKKTIAKYQDKICTMGIIDDEREGKQAVGVLLEIKGDAGNPIAEYDAIAESHGANMSFSDPAVLREIERIPTEVDLTQYKLCTPEAFSGQPDQLVDLRGLNFTTTDPATCKDMDDAIYSCVEDGRLVVYTAVANVTKYVNLNSEIGRRYIKAGFTTYAPNKAYNILPPELSTNICSLNPNVPRLALVVKTVIDQKTGKPISSTIMDAVIESKEKFSYEEAQAICDEHSEITANYLKDKFKKGEPLSREEQVVMNKIASDLLWKGLNSRNLLQFDSNNEYNVTFNEDFSDILDINKEEDIPYHKVIEAFMVTANEATADYALRYNIPNIYRVHDKPNESKIDQAYEFFGFLNIPFEGDLSPRAIRGIIASVKGTEKEKVVNNFLVRMQSKAKYSDSPNPQSLRLIGRPEHKHKKVKYPSEQTENIETMVGMLQSLDKNISHFGLQSEHYSHTTSPIRRVTDYVTHYNVLAHIKGGKMLEDNMVRDIALWANQMEEAVDGAEKEFDELNSAIYCEHHIGEVMHGQICSFRKLVDKGDITSDEVMVIVENEDKGIRVQIPLTEVLASRGGTTKNIAISPFGSAVVNKESGAPILTVCQDVTFRITESNRVTRSVMASMDLHGERVYDGPFLPKIDLNPRATTRKRERMLKNQEFLRQHSGDTELLEAEEEMRGLKFRNQIKYGDYSEDVTCREALHANRSNSRKVKRKKEEDRIRNKTQEIYFDDEHEDENDRD